MARSPSSRMLSRCYDNNSLPPPFLAQVLARDNAHCFLLSDRTIQTSSQKLCTQHFLTISASPHSSPPAHFPLTHTSLHNFPSLQNSLSHHSTFTHISQWRPSQEHSVRSPALPRRPHCGFHMAGQPLRGQYPRVKRNDLPPFLLNGGG